jgi:superfamily II DNA or RNA helicase
MLDYQTFLEQKRHYSLDSGMNMNLDELHSGLFDFQRDIVAWTLRKGRAAIFADCGLGKTIMQLEWASQIHKKTNKSVLIITPLAVSLQTVHESEKFGIECQRLSGAVNKGINVINYERLHYLNPSDFIGIVLDESSITMYGNGCA